MDKRNPNIQALVKPLEEGCHLKGKGKKNLDREYFTPTWKVLSIYPRNLLPLLRAAANKSRCTINIDMVNTKTGEKSTLTIWDKGEKSPVVQFSKP